MKAVQVVARGEAVFVDVEPPKLVPGHAIIRPLLLSLCGSDVRMLHHSADECYPFPIGTTGHEMVGVVEEFNGSTSLRPGDRTLTLAPGHRAMCERYLAPLEHILKLPSAPEEGKPLAHLLQAQQYGTVIYAAKRLPNVIGQDVAIIGQGSAGLWFAFQMRRMGARRIIAVDLDASRLKLSKHFGATDTICNEAEGARSQLEELTGGRLADLVIEAAGEADAINLAVDLVKKNGRILFFGYPRGQYLPFNFELFFHKCCDATTIVGVSDEPDLVSTRMAIDTIARGEIDVSPLITHHFPFDRVIEAYELHRTRGDGAVKIVIEVGE